MPKNRPSKFKKLFGNLGQGLITGASDDDPSGIATYSQAGAQFGNKFLWTALLTYPLIFSVQEMCARIGLVTDLGLTGVIKKYYSRYVLYFIVALSFPSIVLNIGADIAGMGAVSNLIFPKIPSFVFSIIFTIVLIYAIIFWKYNRISFVLKWLCITLFSYILIPFMTHTDVALALRNTFLPEAEFTKEYFLMFVAILGTTISPYLFFWQTSMEVEEINQKHLIVDKVNISEAGAGVGVGLLFTNIVFYFIILAAGTVLFQNGIHNINTVEEAANALRPLAGEYAYLLFSIGVIGTGALAIPVLAGSVSYMMCETFEWKEGLDFTFKQAKGFYITIIISLIIGLLINLAGISPVKVLIFTAVLYGLVSPFLIGFILHICNNKKIMQSYTNNTLANFTGFATLIIMSVAAIVLIYFIVFN